MFTLASLRSDWWTACPELVDDFIGIRITHCTKQKLRHYLRNDTYDILHFVGHGCIQDGSSTLLLEDGQGNPDPLDGRTLGRNLMRSQVRLAVLNSCLSALDSESRVSDSQSSRPAFIGAAPALVDAGLMAVVAMQFPITDKCARVFAQDFYEGLAHLSPLDECLAQAREALCLAAAKNDGPAWATPVLFMRATDGLLFDGPVGP
jgi:CHAT domain-containing protein